MFEVDTDKRIELIEQITDRLLLYSHVDNPDTAREIALRWVK